MCLSDGGFWLWLKHTLFQRWEHSLLNSEASSSLHPPLLGLYFRIGVGVTACPYCPADMALCSSCMSNWRQHRASVSQRWIEGAHCQTSSAWEDCFYWALFPLNTIDLLNGNEAVSLPLLCPPLSPLFCPFSVLPYRLVFFMSWNTNKTRRYFTNADLNTCPSWCHSYETRRVGQGSRKWLTTDYLHGKNNKENGELAGTERNRRNLVNQSTGWFGFWTSSKH